MKLRLPFWVIYNVKWLETLVGYRRLTIYPFLFASRSVVPPRWMAHEYCHMRQQVIVQVLGLAAVMLLTNGLSFWLLIPVLHIPFGLAYCIAWLVGGGYNGNWFELEAEAYAARHEADF